MSDTTAPVLRDASMQTLRRTVRGEVMLAGEGRLDRTGGVRLVSIVATLLCLVAVLVAGMMLLVPSGRDRAPEPTAHTDAVGWGRMPVTARGAVSAALGRHDPAFRIVHFRASNAAHRVHATFSPLGATVASGSARVRLALTSYGRAGAMRDLAPALPRSRANRIAYAHGGVDEWWTNGPLGLEQGFDVRSAPHGGAGALRLAVSVAGEARSRLTRAGVLWEGGDGHGLRYYGLTATDAHGRALRTSLQLEPGHLLIRVKDHDAAYPVRVDPFVEQAKLSLVGGIVGDAFAVVAVSGHTLAVGAPGRKVGANANQGAVYIFQRGASGWSNATLVAQLTASDGSGGDSLGRSVAISGNTVVTGAQNHKVGNNSNQGAAYVFAKPQGTVSVEAQSAELTTTDGGANDLLGSSVAISGDTLVAGAPGHQVGRSRQGAAYSDALTVAGGGVRESRHAVGGQHETGRSEVCPCREAARARGTGRLGAAVAAKRALSANKELGRRTRVPPNRKGDTDGTSEAQ